GQDGGRETSGRRRAPARRWKIPCGRSIHACGSLLSAVPRVPAARRDRAAARGRGLDRAAAHAPERARDQAGALTSLISLLRLPPPLWAGLSHMVQKLDEKGIVPPCTLDFSAHRSGARVGAEDVEDEPAQ